MSLALAIRNLLLSLGNEFNPIAVGIYTFEALLLRLSPYTTGSTELGTALLLQFLKHI